MVGRRRECQGTEDQEDEEEYNGIQRGGGGAVYDVRNIMQVASILVSEAASEALK